MADNALAIGHNNAGTFLATVLQGIQSEVGNAGCVWVIKNAEDAALFSKRTHTRHIFIRTFVCNWEMRIHDL
jgi:hypothetical protein